MGEVLDLVDPLVDVVLVIGERLLGGYLLLLTIVLFAALAFALFSLRPALRPDSLSLLLSLAVSALIIGVLVLQMLLWTGVIPVRGGIPIRGIGFDWVTQRLASRVRATHPEQRRQRELNPTGPAGTSIGVLAVSIFLAPVGVLLALKLQRRPGINDATRRIANASFWIGILVSTVMVTAIIGLSVLSDRG